MNDLKGIKKLFELIISEREWILAKAIKKTENWVPRLIKKFHFLRTSFAVKFVCSL